ncbi:undecaprenyl-phosphate galactosephosphotransferase [hydrocarbon metagenome]|uniref:Undecaprenyl-phosphate galactosephosphotransferase n=1 Tax=hydrocarbon metagenome TaxID=938273 RepID=A0A0W8FY11_9ZZZZ
MNKRLEKILVLIIDFITINFAWAAFFVLRVETGWFEMFSEPIFLIPMMVVYLYWLLLFLFVGMYRTWFAYSRFDEITLLFKATFVGIFILFFVIFYDDVSQNISSGTRYIIFIYWIIFFFSVAIGRILVRSIQRNLLFKGIGRRGAVIVGFNEKAHRIHNSIANHRGLGLDVKAYVAVKEENLGKEHLGMKAVDLTDNIRSVLEKYDCKEIIIALEHHEEDIFLKVIAKTDGLDVGIKIVPDLYEIISGQARTTQIYGFPLIDIMPQLMPEWEKKVKRLMDIFISLIFIVITSPVLLLTAVAIKLDSKGPVFYKQERSGFNGKVFKIYKFRSMVQDAEKESGPVWSTKYDPRITPVGRIIRKLRLDEIPQVINVLKGEMSFVGPRPERPYFVEKLSEEIPLYKRRLRVRPGITGWAQVKHKYDESIEDVKTKLRYDLFYIENMSLRMDLKIIFRTVFVVLFGKGHYE